MMMLFIRMFFKNFVSTTVLKLGVCSLTELHRFSENDPVIVIIYFFMLFENVNGMESNKCIVDGL